MYIKNRINIDYFRLNKFLTADFSSSEIIAIDGICIFEWWLL